MLRPLDIHAVDQSVADPVNVDYLTVPEEFSVGRAHDLPELTARELGTLRYPDRFDSRVNLGPLRGPEGRTGSRPFRRPPFQAFGQSTASFIIASTASMSRRSNASYSPAKTRGDPFVLYPRPRERPRRAEHCRRFRLYNRPSPGTNPSEAPVGSRVGDRVQCVRDRLVR